MFRIQKKDEAAIYSSLVNILLIIGAFIFLIGVLTIKTPNLSLNDGNVYEWQGNGVITYAGNEEEITSLPFSARGKEGDILTFTTTLHQTDAECNAIMFRSVHQKVKVYLDGTKVLDYGNNNQVLYGRTPGSLWQLISLPENYDGMELKIELETLYDSYGVSMGQLYIGTKSSLTFMVFEQAWGTIAIGVPVFIMGVAMILMGFLAKRRNASRKLLYLGIFAAMAGAWMVLEARIIQLFSGNPLLYMQLIFIIFSLLPVVLTRFLLTFPVFAKSKYIRAVFGISILNFFVVQILQLADIRDYLDTTYGTHAVFVLLIIGGFFITLKDREKNKSWHDQSILIATTVFSLFGIVDIIRFYMPSGKKDALLFTRIGIALFILILGYSAIRQILREHENIIEEQTLRRLAYTDMMTGLPNRTAFEERMESFRSSGEKPVIAVVDINDLKHINDNFGHKSGDDAICRIGRALADVFRESAEIFRIGGDEFCLLSLVAETDIRELFDKVRKEFIKQDEATPYPLMAAVGYVQTGAEGIDKAFIEADHIMYQNKETIKGR
ncbi:MAG: GGDEF domain-containing protein [Lachnospiraceae bacterium]